MGKYSEVFAANGQSEKTLTPEQAVGAIVFVTMFADSGVDEEEIDYLHDMLSSLEIFDSYTAEEMHGMLNKFTDIYDEEGIGALFNVAVASISEELVETAFEAAVEAVLEDDNLSEEEEEFLKSLQGALSLPDEVAQEIIDDLVGV